MANNDSGNVVNLNAFAELKGVIVDPQELLAQDARQILVNSYNQETGIQGVGHDVSFYAAEEVSDILDAIEARARSVTSSNLLVGAFSTQAEQEGFKAFCQDVIHALPEMRERLLTPKPELSTPDNN